MTEGLFFFFFAPLACCLLRRRAGPASLAGMGGAGPRGRGWGARGPLMGPFTLLAMLYHSFSDGGRAGVIYLCPPGLLLAAATGRLARLAGTGGGGAARHILGA